MTMDMESSSSSQQDDTRGYGNGLLHPSDSQERVLAFMPIPTALLSMLGSSIIIYMIYKSRQQQKKLTPYLRLLFAMSAYDIGYSLVWSVAAFLRPQETSPRLLSFGNNTTCRILGFLNELSHGTLIYQGMLGVYFLLTARYGYSNAYIAQRIEPWMHIISIGYPFAFAIAEAVLSGYGEVTMGIGCWVVVTNDNCANSFFCAARVLRYLSCAVPLAVVMISLVVSNRIILVYAREQMRPALCVTSRSFTVTVANNSSSRLSSDDDIDVENSDNSSETEPESKYVFTGTQSVNGDANDILTGSVQLQQSGRPSNHTISKDQARRLRLVSSQAFLFVACFLISNVWTIFTGLIEDHQSTLEADLAMLVKFYPIFVLQAIFSPLQGFLNMMVFIRPKYLKFRHLHEEESRLWVVKRAILGEGVKPTIETPQQSAARTPNPEANVNTNPPAADAPKNEDSSSDQVAPLAAPSVATRIPKGMVSSLTASRGDFDHVISKEADDERWEDKAKASRAVPLVHQRQRSSLLLCTSSVLDMIGENQESIFEALPVLPGSEDLIDGIYNPKTVHKRWSSGSVQLPRPPDDDESDDAPKQPTKIETAGLSIPSRVASTLDYEDSEETLQPPPPKKNQTAGLIIPARVVSSFDSSCMDDSDIEEESLASTISHPRPRPSDMKGSNHSRSSLKSRESTSSSDRPLMVPQRRMSPYTS